MSNENAVRIVHDFSRNERYLRSLVSKYGNPEHADWLDYRAFKRGL